MQASAFLHKELKEFDTTFEAAVKSRIPLLDTIMQYVARNKGKRLRPIFVLLSAQLCGGVNPATHRAAALIELLHTATLVHDDVVDDAELRRGLFSINAVWKNKIAVLVGDYLLSKGLLLSLNNNDFTILRILAEAVQEMSEGELLQIEKARKLNITEAIYYDVIKAKTASLIGSACAAGAYSASQNTVDSNIAKEMGVAIGMAFQIKDDLFDYTANNSGKPSGNDIKEKKLTLPLIYTLEKCPANIKTKIKYILKNKNKSQTDIDFVIQQVKQYGGIDYSMQQMQLYITKANQLLNHWPSSPAKNVMQDLFTYVIDRKK